jgi:hypothetical protein
MMIIIIGSTTLCKKGIYYLYLTFYIIQSLNKFNLEYGDTPHNKT